MLFPNALLTTHKTAQKRLKKVRISLKKKKKNVAFKSLINCILNSEEDFPPLRAQTPLWDAMLQNDPRLSQWTAERFSPDFKSQVSIEWLLL